MAQIICRELSLGYDGHTVCEHLNFTLMSGDYLAVVGENGSGKSTLLRTLLSLKAPMSGELVFGDGIKKRDMGYLPQQTSVQRDFPALVREVVISGCTPRLGNRPFMGRQQKLEAMQNMKDMGVYDLADKSYKTLSGGQQQRVLLARALCAADKILLLDEPVSGLDPAAAADMYSLIHHLNKHMKMTVIMVTHDIDNALRDANRVLHMSRTPSFFENVEDYRRTYCEGGSGI